MNESQKDLTKEKNYSQKKTKKLNRQFESQVNAREVETLQKLYNKLSLFIYTRYTVECV